MRIAHLIPILLSALLPGMGHIATGRVLKGIAVFFLFGFALDGWVYSRAAAVLPPERSLLGPAALRNASLALGSLLWAYAVLDTAAIALRRRRIAAKAEAATGHIRDALAAYLRNEPQAALASLRAALRINDQDPDALFYLGAIHASLGQARQARKALHKCIRYDHGGKWDAQAQDQLLALEPREPERRPAPPAPAETTQEAET